MNVPLRSRYSMMLLASRRVSRSRQLMAIRFASEGTTGARATPALQDHASTPAAVDPSKAYQQPEIQEYVLPKVEAPKADVDIDELPRVVQSENNPDPRLYRPMPKPKLIFEPPERPRYDPSKPWYKQELNDDDKLLWGILLAVASTIPIGYWWYHYRTAWVKEKREKALQEYLERYPEKRHLADKAAAQAEANAA